MKKWLTDIFYSFPIQLLVLHLRSHHLLLLIWITLGILMTGKLAARFGVNYLFLDPEYLGQVNFISFYIVGMAFGGFYMTWNLTTYLLNAHYFPFLAALARPFTKFCLNNSLIPLVFLGIYFYHIVQFQRYYQLWSVDVVIFNCVGFILGLISLILIVSIYLTFTNKDIFSFVKKRENEPPNMTEFLMPGRRTPNLDVIKTDAHRWKVSTYLTESLKPRLVRSVAHYDSSLIMSIFKQNHLNALVIQLFSLILLITFGYLIDIPSFRIPAGASVFILASIIISISGAVTYWFDTWSVTVFVVILIVINVLTSYDIFNHKNKAYGLNYEENLAYYDYESLDNISRSYVQEDKKNMLGILDKWRNKFEGENPKMVLVCVSGGGLKAAVWAMQVLQETDKRSGGEMLNHTFLMSGASGGIIGTAYLRELYLRKQMGEQVDIYDDSYIDDISKDLLNSIAVTIVANDLFLPWVDFQVGEHTYRKDRGYMFEKQLNENTNYLMNKSISDYRQPEKDAIIPMMFITPSIVNDGRRLIISPQGVSYMTVAPIGHIDHDAVEIDAVDFGRMFEQQEAADLRFTTALRMNATYPYVLPNVFLPSEPGIEVMDAGFRDNYGVKSAVRFMQVFKDWIDVNTSGVVLVQIIGRDKLQAIEPSDSKGLVESIFNPLDIAGQILSLQEYEHDTNLGLIYDLMGKDKFELIRFTYRPTAEDREASMTFHLTKREKNDILQAIELSENEAGIKRLEELLKTQILEETKPIENR